MKCLTSLATIATVGLLAGCYAEQRTDDPTSTPPNQQSGGVESGRSDTPNASAQPTPSAPGTTPATSGVSTTDVDANLKALRDLQIVDVSGIVENIPEQANCYNLA